MAWSRAPGNRRPVPGKRRTRRVRALPAISSVACAWPAGSSTGGDRGDAARRDEPELVGPVRPRWRGVGQHDDAGVLRVGHDDGHPAATGEVARAQRRVRRRQHRLDAVGLLLGQRDGGPLVVEPLLLHRVGRRGRADAEHTDDRGGRGEPTPAGHRRRDPAPVPVRGQLGRGGRAGEHLLAHPRRRHGPGALGEAGRRLAVLGDLDGAGLALGEVTVERDALEVVHRVERVRAAEGVDVRARHGVTSTFRQSRRRIRPSRIRVLTVGRAASSSVATSR